MDASGPKMLEVDMLGDIAGAQMRGMQTIVSTEHMRWPQPPWAILIAAPARSPRSRDPALELLRETPGTPAATATLKAKTLLSQGECVQFKFSVSVSVFSFTYGGPQKASKRRALTAYGPADRMAQHTMSLVQRSRTQRTRMASTFGADNCSDKYGHLWSQPPRRLERCSDGGHVLLTGACGCVHRSAVGSDYCKWYYCKNSKGGRRAKQNTSIKAVANRHVPGRSP